MERLTSVLNAMADGVYIINADYDVEFVNRAMIKSLAKGTGKKCYQLLYGQDARCPWCRTPEIFQKRKTLHWELRLPGDEKILDLIEYPIQNQDGSISKLTICRDLTEIKRQEEEFKASEEDYRRLFELVGCGVFFSSKEGKFLNVNKALLKMLGYEDKAEFLSMDIARDLYVRPEDRRKFQDLIEKHGMIHDYEVEFKHKDGRPVPVLLAGHVRYDAQGKVLGYEGINVDLTQHKQMAKELQEAHDFLNNIIQSSPNGIMAADMKGNIILWNRAAEDLLGYKVREIVGKINIVDIYPDGVAKEVMRLLRSPQHGGVGKLNSYPLEYKRRDGEYLEANLSAAIVYNPQGREVASVGIIVDLKERMEMERELRKVQEQLLQSEKLAAMGRLTSQIAHELNNPLYGIMNTLELLKTEISPENKRRKLLEMSLSETMRLSEMLRKMLLFSKPDQEEKGFLDVNAVLEEILLLNERRMRENDIQVVKALTPDPGQVYASRNQLRQVFLNMISNAQDAMPEGGELYVKTTASGGNFVIEISDSGMGINKENLHKIFDAFFTTKDSVKGVGLGLSVCYGFIKDHGGDIQVRSEPGAGTTFYISLPLSRSAGARIADE